MTTRLLPLAAFPFLALLAGCGGPDPATVSGKITLKGRPPEIERMTISFLGADGRPATAAVAPDGSYSLSGVAAGEMHVGFGVASLGPDEKPPAAPDKQLGRSKGAGHIPVERMEAKPAGGAAKIPDRYRDPLKSGITTTLNPGPNTFDFDIK